MKKFTYILLVLSMLTLVACASSNQDNNTVEQDNNTVGDAKSFEYEAQPPENITTRNKQNTAISTSEEKPKKEEKKDQSKKIGGFATEILNKDGDRVNNIEIATEAISGTSIKSGEEFSFNDTLGRRTRKKGYEEAPIFVRDKKGKVKDKEAVGGGICQVSTTLYNAVLDAGLEATERHPHSKRVHYVPKGKDASVVYGSKDLKFINTKDETIFIKASTDGEKVYASIYTGVMPK